MRPLSITCLAGDIALSSVRDPVTGEARGDVMHLWLRVGANPLDVAVQVLVREPGARLRLEEARGRALTFALTIEPDAVALPESTPPPPAPPAAEPREMSREAFEAMLEASLDDHVAAVTRNPERILAHDAALRARAEWERQRADRAEAYKERLRGECVGTLTDVGIYMLVEQDPTADGEVASAIRRLARERDEAREQRAHWKEAAGLAVEAGAILKTERNAARAALSEMRGLCSGARAEVADLRSRLATAEAEVARLRECHRTASGLANALNRVRDEARGRRWIPAGEWGSYEYTEQTVETLRKEIGWLLDGVERVAAEALAASGDLAHAECCGGERKEAPIEREIAALRERVARLVEAGMRLHALTETEPFARNAAVGAARDAVMAAARGEVKP